MFARDMEFTGEVNNFIPFQLNKRARGKHFERYWDFVIERHMRSQEIVMSDKEGGKADGAILGFKAAGSTDVIFIGSIEPFADLFEMAM